MEFNSLATEDAVDELLPCVADEKIQGRSSRWSARPILAGLCVFAVVVVVITFGKGSDLGTMDAEGLQELREWLPWKEGEGKKKQYYINADNPRASTWRRSDYQVCVKLPAWGCDTIAYDKFPCAMPSLDNWAISSAGFKRTRKEECDASPSCAGVAGWDDGREWKKVWTIQIGKTRLTEKKEWTSCLKKRIHCGDGYFEYKGAEPSWCHSTYSPIVLATGTHLMQEHTEQQVKAKCDADPGCTGYTHMTDQIKIYLVNNHARRTKKGHALSQNKWWKSCMKMEWMRTNWHTWCW